MNKIELLEVIEYYKTQSPQLKELLDFFYSVFNLKKQHIKRIPSVLSISIEDAIVKLKSDKYLIEDISWTIDKNSFEDIIKDLIKLLEQNGKTVAKFDIPDTIPTDSKKSPFNSPFTKWGRGGFDLLLKDKDITETEKNTISYISFQSLSVFYQKIAETFKDIDYKLYWTKSICPVCGSFAKISKLEKEDGKRIIACFLCWTEWLVARISCVYCGNTEQNMLKYFYAEDNKSYRVDVCDKCNKYIKTIDERLLDRDVILELEDNITYHLDTLAVSEGYNNPFL